MPTYTTPRPPRQVPGRGAPQGRTMPAGRVVPPDDTTPRRGADQMPPRRRARPGPQDPVTPRTQPFSAPRHTRPFAGPATIPAAKPAKPPKPPKPAKPAKLPKPPKPAKPPRPAKAVEPTTRPALRPAGRPGIGPARPRHPRAPFILLLVGLLGGALISLLFISTTLAEGSYRITNLQQQNANLAKQEQLLSQQVAQASSPAQIAQEAEAFGMQPNPNLQFINLKTGKIVSGHPSRADSEINVPGYNP
jgi:hypothetical protein